MILSSLHVRGTDVYFSEFQRLQFSEETLDQEDECLEDLGLVDGAEIALLLDVEGGAKGDSRYKKSTVR